MQKWVHPTESLWSKAKLEYKEKCMVPTVKHGGGSVLMWGCMSAAGVGELHFIDGIMNSQMYCSILKEKMLPSLRALGRRALFQHDNDPKHTSKATVGFLKKKCEQGESDSVAKYVSWSEPNRTPLGNSEETSWASLSIQHPISKRGHSWRMEKDRSGKMLPTCSFHA